MIGTFKPKKLYKIIGIQGFAYGDVRDWMKNESQPYFVASPGALVVFLRLEPFTFDCSIGWFLAEDKVVSKRFYAYTYGSFEEV